MNNPDATISIVDAFFIRFILVCVSRNIENFNHRNAIVIYTFLRFLEMKNTGRKDPNVLGEFLDSQRREYLVRTDFGC